MQQNQFKFELKTEKTVFKSLKTTSNFMFDLIVKLIINVKTGIKNEGHLKMNWFSAIKPCALLTNVPLH